MRDLHKVRGRRSLVFPLSVSSAACCSSFCLIHHSQEKESKTFYLSIKGSFFKKKKKERKKKKGKTKLVSKNKIWLDNCPPRSVEKPGHRAVSQLSENVNASAEGSSQG